jgi:hypothetical protein
MHTVYTVFQIVIKVLIHPMFCACLLGASKKEPVLVQVLAVGYE